MTDLTSSISKSPLFRNIPPEQYDELLSLLRAKERHFSKGETIYNQGQLQRLSGIVLSGTAELHFCDENYNLVNLIHLHEGELFGAAISLTGGKTSPMELCAVTDCHILFLDFSVLLDANGDAPEELSPAAHQLTVNLLQGFARRLQFLSGKVRVLSQRRLRDKIKVYLQTLPRTEDGLITLTMNRIRLADYLYVDRSALSRELSRMQKDGLLEVKGKTIRIIDPESFFE